MRRSLACATRLRCERSVLSVRATRPLLSLLVISVMPVAYTYVLGNTCTIDKTTPPAEAGDTAVVYSVNNNLPNNQAEVWIYEDGENATAISTHVKAVEAGRMGEQLGAARLAELRNAARRKLEACTVRSFNVSFASQYRELLLVEPSCAPA